MSPLNRSLPADEYYDYKFCEFTICSGLGSANAVDTFSTVFGDLPLEWNVHWRVKTLRKASLKFILHILILPTQIATAVLSKDPHPN